MLYALEMSERQRIVDQHNMNMFAMQLRHGAERVSVEWDTVEYEELAARQEREIAQEMDRYQAEIQALEMRAEGAQVAPITLDALLQSMQMGDDELLFDQNTASFEAGILELVRNLPSPPASGRHSFHSIVLSVPELVLAGVRVTTNECERRCWKCMSVASHYKQGMFWCDDCAMEERNGGYPGTPVDNIFGGERYIREVGILMEMPDNDMTFREFVQFLCTYLTARLNYWMLVNDEEVDRVMCDGTVEHYTTWSNPLRGNNVPFYEMVRELLNALDRCTDDENRQMHISNAIISIIKHSANQELRLYDSQECSCDDQEMLLAIMCSRCRSGVLEVNGSTGYKFHHDIRQDYTTMTERRYGRFLMSLPSIQYDNNNRLLGQDDHGHVIVGETGEDWLKLDKKDTCAVCFEENDVYVCPSGHAFCEQCILEWFLSNIGSCPVCRCRMNPL